MNFLEYECQKCHHKWQPRQEKVIECPSCKSRNWNKEPKVKE